MQQVNTKQNCSSNEEMQIISENLKYVKSRKAELYGENGVEKKKKHLIKLLISVSKYVAFFSVLGITTEDETGDNSGKGFKSHLTTPLQKKEWAAGVLLFDERVLIWSLQTTDRFKLFIFIWKGGSTLPCHLCEWIFPEGQCDFIRY